MARPSEDDELKEARGTLRADRGGHSVEAAPMKEMYKTPVGLLSRTSKFEYRRVVRALKEAGTDAEVDRSMLVAYCNEMANYLDSSKELAESEEIAAGMEVTAETIAKYKALMANMSFLSKKKDAALKNAVKLAELFGLTPSARGKIKAPKKKKEADPTAEAFGRLLSA